MNANPKRPLEEHGNDGKPEIYEASVAWGDERPYKFPRKDPREVERKIPATSAQPQQQQQQQQPQLQHWGYVPGYPPLVISEGYENKEKERERESSKEAAKMGEAKDEEVKIEGKAQVEENMELKPEKDTDLNKLEKNQNVDGKDPKGDSNYRHHHTRSENEGCESVPPEGGEFCEAKETVGENRVGDWRKEKEERKRKEENLNAGGERKEKEKVKDKEISQPVKEVEVKEENMEIDGRITGKEVDDKDRKKEREKQGDVERERHERRTRHHNHDKEVTDDGLGDGEGNLEKDKGDSFYGGIHQRRRMLRPRGHSQAGSREARSRFRPRDSDGFQGRSESSAVTYKVGECMQEIIKLWKEFEASNDLRNMENPAIEHPTLEIRIPAEHVTTANHQVRGSQLWGTDIYTDDSDLVAVLMHTGYYRPTAALPPPSIQELRATIRVLAPSDSYRSTLRNSVRSRAWGAASGCSYKVEKCRIMKKGGGSIELEPCLMRISAVAPTLAPAAMERTMTTRAAASSAYRQQRYMREVTIQYNLCNEPWMKYSISIVADRGLKRSQFTSARLKKGEVLFVETHWARYELSYDGEKATSNGPFGATTATSAPSQVGNLCERMDKTPVNEMEKHLPVNSQNGDKVHSVGENADRFKWARCKQPLPQKVMQSIGIPLPHDHVKVLEENLDWEELQWSQTGVWVRGKEYCLTRAHFLSSN